MVLFELQYVQPHFCLQELYASQEQQDLVFLFRFRTHEYNNHAGCLFAVKKSYQQHIDVARVIQNLHFSLRNRVEFQ